MAQGTLITWSLTATYLVHGQVTGFEYESLPGATVTATNLTSNEDGTATVDEGGEYEIDLGDTADFPSGYQNGDEIQITVTHREVSRTWKRRVSGSEILQDLHFTNGTYEGALRKAKFLPKTVSTGVSGFTVTLPDSETKDVLRVTKNGTLLASSAWTFTKPRTLTLTAALSTSDVLEITRATNRGIQDAKDAVKLAGEPPVRSATTRYYSTLRTTRVPDLQDLSELLAGAFLRDEAYAGRDNEDAEAKKMRAYANSRLDEIKAGPSGLTDQDGEFVTPSAQTTTTPKSSTTPTRQFTTFTTTKVNL